MCFFFLFPADSSSYCIVWGPLNYKYTFMYKMAQNPKREASLKRKSSFFLWHIYIFLSLLITAPLLLHLAVPTFTGLSSCADVHYSSSVMCTAASPSDVVEQSVPEQWWSVCWMSSHLSLGQMRPVNYPSLTQMCGQQMLETETDERVLLQPFT